MRLLLLRRRRCSYFEAWFDEEKNSSGALCSKLSNEASMVKSLVADRISLLVQTTSAVTIAMIMGLVLAWKLAIVMIAVQPLTIFCFYTRKVLLSSILTNFVKAQNHSTQIKLHTRAPRFHASNHNTDLNRGNATSEQQHEEARLRFVWSSEQQQQEARLV